MVELKTLEEVLDFAILQEKAAQQFYLNLSQKVHDPEVSLFYRTLVEEECVHEKELRKLKKGKYMLLEPDLAMLQKSGYLEALPAGPDMTILEAMSYALKKERSARLLYAMLADCAKIQELKMIFRMLADQEQLHAEYFQYELEHESART